MTPEIVTIHFSNFGYGRAHINLLWVQGKKLKEYLRDPALKKYALLNQAMRLHSRGIRDRQSRRIRLTATLKPGDVIHVGGR